MERDRKSIEIIGAPLPVGVLPPGLLLLLEVNVLLPFPWPPPVSGFSWWFLELEVCRVVVKIFVKRA